MLANLLAPLAISVITLGHAPDPPSDASEPPLAGPEVEAEAADPSLVERNAQGRIERLKIWPEQAAIDLLELSEETAQRVRDVINERAAAMDRVVQDQMQRVQQLGQAAEAQEWARALSELRKLYEDFRAELGRDSLQERIESVLPPEKVEEYRSIVEEYWKRVISEEMGEEVEGLLKTVQATIIQKAMSIELFGEEIGRSYERVASDGGEEIEYVMSQLQLRDEQKPEIRAILRDLFTSAEGEPTEDQWKNALREIHARLDCEQRAILFEMVLSAE